MFAREQQIMDLWDAGRSIEAISRELRVDRRNARKIVYRYAGRSEDDGFEDMVRLGSLQLLAALRRHHPESCGGAP